MPSNDRRLSFLFLILALISCRANKTADHPPQPADLILVVEQPFRDSEYLATVRVKDIKECIAGGNCQWLKRKNRLIAHFVFTHKSTENDLRFRALREHLPGVKAGDHIRAYCIAERQKHGEYLLKIYQYTLL